MFGKIFTRAKEVYDWAERAHFLPVVWEAIKKTYGYIAGGGVFMTVAAALAEWSGFAIFCAFLLGVVVVALTTIAWRVLYLSHEAAFTVFHGGPAPPSQRFTPYEREQRLRAIDAAYDFIDTRLVALQRKAQDLVNVFPIRAQERTIVEGLDGLADYSKREFQEWNALVARYEYLSDVRNAASEPQWSSPALPNASSLLRAEIQELEQRGHHNEIMRLLQNNKYYVDWQSAIMKLNYIPSRKMELRKLREKIEAIQAHGG